MNKDVNKCGSDLCCLLHIYQKNVVSQSYNGKLIYDCEKKYSKPFIKIYRNGTRVYISQKKYSKPFIKIYRNGTRVYISHHLIDDIVLFIGDTAKININLIRLI